MEKAGGDPGPSPAPMIRWIRSLTKTRERKSKKHSLVLEVETHQRAVGRTCGRAATPGMPALSPQISLLRGKERREGLGWAGPPGTLPPAVTTAGSLVMSICGQDCGKDIGDVDLPHGLQSHGGQLGVGLAEAHTRPKRGSSAWLFKCDGGGQQGGLHLATC